VSERCRGLVAPGWDPRHGEETQGAREENVEADSQREDQRAFPGAGHAGSTWLTGDKRVLGLKDAVTALMIAVAIKSQAKRLKQHPATWPLEVPRNRAGAEG